MYELKPINEYSFRDLCGSYCIIKHEQDANVNQAFYEKSKNDDFDFEDGFIKNKLYLKEPINIENPTNGFLAYCYMDHDAGLSFVYLCNVLIEDDKISFSERDDFSGVFRHRRNENYEILILEDDDSEIKDKYRKHAMEMTDGYSTEKLDFLRSVEILDSLRNEDNPDDIMVVFYKEDLQQMEGIWVRLEDNLDNSLFTGKLLNQPFQDEIGLNIGDDVLFIIIKKEEKVMAFAILQEKPSEKVFAYINAYFENMDG